MVVVRWGHLLIVEYHNAQGGLISGEKQRTRFIRADFCCGLRKRLLCRNFSFSGSSMVLVAIITGESRTNNPSTEGVIYSSRYQSSLTNKLPSLESLRILKD